MPETTARFALPFIMPGQAQKELYHNEALTRLDILAHASVEGPPVAAPPASPAQGQCWIVDGGATGEWAGRAGQLAAWSSGGWRFVQPKVGMSVWNEATGFPVRWTGTNWGEGELRTTKIVIAGLQVVGPRQPAIASPSGGTIIDVEARAALAQVIATLMSHGLTG